MHGWKPGYPGKGKTAKNDRRVKVYLGLHAVGDVRGWLKEAIYRGSDQAEKNIFRKFNQ